MILMPNCKECNDTGLILTETVHLSRPYYSKKNDKLVYDVYGKDDWAETICYCKSDDD